MKKLLVTLLLCTQLVPCFAVQDYWDEDKGVYVDGRGQIPEYQRILPPNPEAIPDSSRPTKVVVPYDKYYEYQKEGIRPGRYQTQRVSEYNIWYSTRRAEPYTIQEFMDVYCTGTKDYKNNMCSTPQYNVYFVRARDWAFGVASLAWKNLGKKKNSALFACVDEIGLDAEAMHDLKRWAEFTATPVFMGTIDSYIPLSYLN